MQNCWNGKGKNKATQWKPMVVERVRHVPDLRKNLISIGQLASKGCISTFTNKVWKVTKGSHLIANREKVGTLYLCTGNTNFISL